MQRIVRILRNFGKKGDLLLLFLCLLATGFGCVVISSATHYLAAAGSSRCSWRLRLWVSCSMSC